MECQECHKRPATLHFTQVINNNKTELHVCEVCAKEKGYMTYPEESYSLHDLLSGLFNFDSSQMGGHQSSSFKQIKDLQCPKCNLSLTEFKQNGKFGCAACYEAFSLRLDPLLRRVHSGNTRHNGKIPKRKGGNLHLKKQIEEYREGLQKLIETEAFEDAAKLRDKIKELEKQHRDMQAGDQS